MENASTALLIVASILIAMLLAGLMVYAFQTVSTFAQKQVTQDDVSEILKFNQPFLEFEARATHDFSGNDRDIEIGSTAEDVISIVNYTNHINTTSAYKVEFILILDHDQIKAEDFDSEKQQEFIEYDLKEREISVTNSRLKYHCKLSFNKDDIAPRVNKVVVKIY